MESRHSSSNARLRQDIRVGLLHDPIPWCLEHMNFFKITYPCKPNEMLTRVAVMQDKENIDLHVLILKWKMDVGYPSKQICHTSISTSWSINQAIAALQHKVHVFSFTPQPCLRTKHIALV